MALNPIIAIDYGRSTWFRARLMDWSRDRFRDFPWRHTKDPYAIAIAECLLQKTEASRVVPIYETLLAAYPNIEALAAAPLEDLNQTLQPLGLHFRGARLQEMARTICDRYDGIVPDREADLLALPGVGPYTARSICTNAFGQPLAILDVNVARIIERFFGVRGGRIKSRDRLLWEMAQAIAPPTEVSYWNLTLLDFGALVCKAPKPLCGNCPLRERCHFFQPGGIASEGVSSPSNPSK